MSTYLLSSEPRTEEIEALEAKLRELVPSLIRIVKIEDIARLPVPETEGRATVIFVTPTLPSGGVDTIIKVTKLYRQRAFFILVSKEISAADYKRLIRSEAADWVATSSLQEIPEIIGRQSIVQRDSEVPGPQKKKKPTLLSFLPATGGVGNTTIALEVALHIKGLKANRTRKICYVDLDFQTSHVCDFLDIEARFQIQELFDRPERLDDHLFELFVAHHSSGLDIFAAPRSKLDPCSLNVAALDALLEMILVKYDFVVFDLPVAWFAWTVPTLKNSDMIVLTTVNTIPCLRQTRVTLDAVLEIKGSASQVAVAINRVTRNIFGRIKRRKHVEAVLAQAQVFYVQDDPYAVDRANTGTPVALGGASRYAKDFTNLAKYCGEAAGTARSATEAPTPR